MKAGVLSLRPTASAIGCSRTVRKQVISVEVEIRGRFLITGNGTKEGAVAGNESSQLSCRQDVIEPGDFGRSSRKRNSSQTVTDVRYVTNDSKETGCESRGAFTPTNSPCNRMFEDRPKAGDLCRGGDKE